MKTPLITKSISIKKDLCVEIIEQRDSESPGDSPSKKESPSKRNMSKSVVELMKPGGARINQPMPVLDSQRNLSQSVISQLLRD